MLLLFSLIILLFSSIAFISTSLALTAADRIFYGVRMHNLSLSGLTRAEAQRQIEDFYREKLADKPLLTLHSEAKTWEISAAEIDFSIDAAKTAEKAYAAGRAGTLFNVLYERFEAAQHGIELTGVVHYDQEKLTAILEDISQELAAKKTQDAYCSFENGRITIHPEVIGYTLDITQFSSELGQKILSLSLPFSSILPMTESPPKITAQDLNGVDTRLASFTSRFNAGNVNRSENIKIAASSVNRLFIRPEQTISFNNLVGPRIAQAGFKEAPVIVEGRTVPDIGGGVCQVSSALYNAILLADMQPTERTPHFHPLGYVPIGMDATVADNLIDFKFKNTLPHSVYVLAEISGGELTISVYGSAEDRGEAAVTLESSVDKTLPYAQKTEHDPSLPEGKKIVKEEGITGYIVSSYRIKSMNGREISRELLYVDEYSPEDEIIVIGGNG